MHDTCDERRWESPGSAPEDLVAIDPKEVDGEFELFGEEAEGAEGWVSFCEFGDAAGLSKARV